MTKALIGCKYGLLGVLIALSGCTTHTVYEACNDLIPDSPGAHADASTTAYLNCMAERGHREAQLRLGMRYEAGEGVTQDFAKAVHWYEKSARDELDRSYFSMVRPNESVSVIQFNSETVNPVSGLPDAKYAMGRMYYLGRGVEKNDKKARKWFESAALFGHQSAQEWLRIMENNKS